MQLSNPLFNLEALELARGGARQILLPDVITAQPFGGRDLVGERFNIEADRFLRVDDLALAQPFKVRHDHGVQSLGRRISRTRLQRHHTNLFDVLRLQVVRLDLFGIHIFSVGEHNHFLAPPGDEKIAAGIEIAEVAGVEPAVAKHLRRGLRAIPVSLHHDGAANRNFARWRRAVLHRFRVHNSCFDTGQRWSDRAKYNFPRGIEECAAAGFRKAVGVENVDAKRVKVAGDGRIKSRTSGHQIAHARAEGGVNLSEEKLAGVNSNAAQPTVERHQRARQSQRDLATLVQLFDNFFVNQVVELGHHAKRGDVAFPQSAQQFGRVQRFEVDDARAVKQGQEKVRHLREHVKHGENSEQGILRTNLDYREHRIRLADEVGVGEHDAFGIGSGA